MCSARSLLLVLPVFVITVASLGGADAQATPAQDAPGIQKKRLQGMLVFVGLHDEGGQWGVKAGDGTLTPFGRGVNPPKKDKDNKDIEPGVILDLNCPVDANGQCSYVAPADTTLLAGATAPTTTGVVQRLLTMIVDYTACGYPTTVNSTYVTKTYLGANQDGNGGIALKFEQCSYGALTVSPTAFNSVVISPACPAEVVVNCSWSAIANGADSAAKALLGDAVFNNFTHYTYILPLGFESICRWSGLALVPGKQTWLQTSSYGLNRWATAMQESIHNYGLWHSWQGGLEYEDYSTAMGRGNACPNSAEISRMGWSTPAAGGGSLTSSLLTPGVGSTFNLPATYLTSNGNYLRVQPDWLASYSDILQGMNLYLAVRVAKVGDAALAGSYVASINIHTVNASMDNSPGSYWYGDRKISFINWVAPNSQLMLSSFNLVVYGSSWVGTDILRVYLCRYVSSSTECPSLAFLEGRPSPPPSPSPPSPSPPSPPSPTCGE
ncbi:Autolysin [Tetrabaena socialis]|uniref:Autolysin n=1 Tax=Tetrabaena socialis TaxID=47790 RepID=A0A2J8ABJ5_9CHLO|nr:Autolysin [Tetrabaena socialis]|eukprot:PNH09895.1 Autolysin [Tetrabaena socialis]